LRSLDPAPGLFESGRNGLPTFAQGGSGNSPRMISAVPHHTFDIAGENEPNRRATRVCATSWQRRLASIGSYNHNFRFAASKKSGSDADN